jgi:hemoglobin
MSEASKVGEDHISANSAAEIEVAIEKCVRLFYARAHADPLLGPVMTAAIPDFERHIRTICDFWSRALLGTERYQGRAFPVHARLPIRPEHFQRWLGLFAEAVGSELPAPQATAAIDKAQHMAKSFMAGLFPFESPQMLALRAGLAHELPEAQASRPVSRRS